jgi:ABC-2 type transport system permease protein
MIRSSASERAFQASQSGAGDYLQFLAPGIVTMGILFTAVFSGIEIIWDRQFGFLKETLVAPVSRLNIVLGRTLGSATVALIQGAIVFVVCLIAGFRVVHPLLLPVAVVFMVLIAVFCTAIGTVVGSVLQDMQGFPLIMNFIVLPLFFFSSALFPLDGLPKPLQIGVQRAAGANPRALLACPMRRLGRGPSAWLSHKRVLSAAAAKIDLQRRTR